MLFSTCLRIVRILRSKASWSEMSGLAATIAPGEQRLALGVDVMLEMLDRDGARLALHRQKAHRDRVTAWWRQFEAALLGPMTQQPVRHLDQAAGAVADQRIGADRAAMVEVDEDLQAATDDVVRFSAFDVDDKADAARIMLVARIVESSVPFRCHPRSLFKPAFGLHPPAAVSLERAASRAPCGAVCITNLGKANRGCEKALVFYAAGRSGKRQIPGSRQPPQPCLPQASVHPPGVGAYLRHIPEQGAPLSPETTS